MCESTASTLLPRHSRIFCIVKIMKKILLCTAVFLAGQSFAASYSVSPVTSIVEPGDLVILTASEWSKWTTTGGTLGSVEGSRIVLETPQEAGKITVTSQSDTDSYRRAIAVIEIKPPFSASQRDLWHMTTFSAGGGYSTAIAEDGTLWAWGKNNWGQVSGSDEKNVLIPTQIPGMTGIQYVTTLRNTNDSKLTALDEEQRLWLWGANLPAPKAVASSIISMKPEGFYIHALDRSGARYSAIYDGTGLSLETKEGGSFYTNGMTLTSENQWRRHNGTVRNPILNSVRAHCSPHSRLDIFIDEEGQGFSLPTDSAIDQKLAGFNHIDKIDCNNYWGFFVTNQNEVYSFKYDSYGNFDLPKPIQGLKDIVDVSVSATHALFLRKDGTLFALSRDGKDNFGELGNGTSVGTASVVEVLGIKVMIP